MSRLEHFMSIRPFLVIIGLLLTAPPTVAAEPAGSAPQVIGLVLPAMPTVAAEPAGSATLVRIAPPAAVQADFRALQQSCGVWVKHLPINTASPAFLTASSPYDAELQAMCDVVQDPVSLLWRSSELGAVCAIVGLIFIAVFMRFLRIMVFGFKPLSWPTLGPSGRQATSQGLRS